jgi:quercetin dioxygenase-like cupin family protein
MSTYRLYSGSDGVSRLEPLDFTQSSEFSEPRAAKAINFNTHEVGWTVDVHPAPRRQVVFVVSGQLEIGLEDGTRQLFSPGDVFLADDTSGRGHSTRTHGDLPCILATVPLAVPGNGQDGW